MNFVTSATSPRRSVSVADSRRNSRSGTLASHHLEWWTSPRLLVLDLGPGIPERDSTVEDQSVPTGVDRVADKVSGALELVTGPRRILGHARLDLGPGQRHQRAGVERRDEVLAFGQPIGLGHGEQAIVQSQLAIERVR